MSLLRCRMARVVWVYHGASPRRLDGRLYTAHACGRQRPDGTWAGWIELVSLDGAGVLRTPHETTQPVLVELINWAGGVTSAHLQAALERAIHAARRFAFTRSPTQSFYDRPSSPEQSVTGETAPVPDPFLAYAKGENVLRQQLAEVPSSLLRAMIIAYDFADPSDRDLHALTHVELIELIVGAIRTRFAA
jgi:hypothetical protein